MPLPTIDPYPMPEPGEVPASKVTWSLDPERAVLLVHDAQNHFMAAYRRDAEPFRTLVASITSLRDACARHGIPVVFSGKEHQTPAERGLELDMWGPGMGPDPFAAAIIDELAPRDTDIRLVKYRYSAFTGSALATLVNGRDQLIVTGVYAHIGVQLTAADAFMREIRPFVVADAVADFSAAHHRGALEWLASRCATVVTTRQLLETLMPQSFPADIDALRAAVADVLGEDPAQIADDDDLTLWGMDSIRVMTLIERWRAAGATVEFEDLAEDPTLTHWSTVLGGNAVSRDID